VIERRTKYTLVKSGYLVAQIEVNDLLLKGWQLLGAPFKFGDTEIVQALFRIISLEEGEEEPWRDE
jgi:hypothetical protein